MPMTSLRQGALLSSSLLHQTRPINYRLLFATSRSYATSNTLGKTKSSSRKQVTVTTDDGQVQWKELTVGEKAARTTQQSFNLGVIILGFGMTIGVAYILYTEIFASDSKTRHFNRAIDRIRGDPRALELLDSGQTIRAFGEPTLSKWSRNRPIASSTGSDQTGIEHFRMHFNVEGSVKSGVAQVHLVKGPGSPEWQYRALAIDVQGHPRLYLEDASASEQRKKPGLKMLGIQWR